MKRLYRHVLSVMLSSVFPYIAAALYLAFFILLPLEKPLFYAVKCTYVTQNMYI